MNSSSVPHSRPSVRPLSILVVDDEPLIRWSLRQGFLSRGHAVTTAGTGAEAVKAFSDGGRFDAVILDYRLPDRQDLSLLGDVRRIAPDAVVVMMTAFADEGMRMDALNSGARTVIDKPFVVKSFVERIEGYL